MMKFFSILLCFFVGQLRAQQYFPNGKLEHIEAGAIISVLSYSGISLLCKDQPKVERRALARKVSLATVFVAAFGRELYDYYKYQKINAWNDNTRIDGYGDFVTTCLSSMTVSLVIPF